MKVSCLISVRGPAGIAGVRCLPSLLLLLGLLAAAVPPASASLSEITEFEAPYDTVASAPLRFENGLLAVDFASSGQFVVAPPADPSAGLKTSVLTEPLVVDAVAAFCPPGSAGATQVTSSFEDGVIFLLCPSAIATLQPGMLFMLSPCLAEIVSATVDLGDGNTCIQGSPFSLTTSVAPASPSSSSPQLTVKFSCGLADTQSGTTMDGFALISWTYSDGSSDPSGSSSPSLTVASSISVRVQDQLQIPSTYTGIGYTVHSYSSQNNLVDGLFIVELAASTTSFYGIFWRYNVASQSFVSSQPFDVSYQGLVDPQTLQLNFPLVPFSSQQQSDTAPFVVVGTPVCSSGTSSYSSFIWVFDFNSLQFRWSFSLSNSCFDPATMQAVGGPGAYGVDADSFLSICAGSSLVMFASAPDYGSPSVSLCSYNIRYGTVEETMYLSPTVTPFLLFNTAAGGVVYGSAAASQAAVAIIDASNARSQSLSYDGDFMTSGESAWSGPPVQLSSDGRYMFVPWTALPSPQTFENPTSIIWKVLALQVEGNEQEVKRPSSSPSFAAADGFVCKPQPVQKDVRSMWSWWPSQEQWKRWSPYFIGAGAGLLFATIVLLCVVRRYRRKLFHARCSQVQAKKLCRKTTHRGDVESPALLALAPVAGAGAAAGSVQFEEREPLVPLPSDSSASGNGDAEFVAEDGFFGPSSLDAARIPLQTPVMPMYPPVYNTFPE